MRARTGAVVAWQAPCTLQHGQKLRGHVEALLRTLGCRLTRVATAELCCGAAGTYNLTQPAMAAELGHRKAANLSEATPDLVVTSNPGCILQIQSAAREQGLPFRVLHIVELLDASISGRAAP